MNNACLVQLLPAKSYLCQILPQIAFNLGFGRQRPCLFLCHLLHLCMTARSSFIREGTVDASIDPTSEASRPMDQTDHQLYQSVVAQQHTAIIALTTQVASIHHVSICSPISKCMTTDRRRASVLVLLLSTLKSSHKVFGESFCDSWSQRSQDQTSPACTRLLWQINGRSSQLQQHRIGREVNACLTGLASYWLTTLLLLPPSTEEECNYGILTPVN